MSHGLRDIDLHSFLTPLDCSIKRWLCNLLLCKWEYFPLTFALPSYNHTAPHASLPPLHWPAFRSWRHSTVWSSDGFAIFYYVNEYTCSFLSPPPSRPIIALRLMSHGLRDIDPHFALNATRLFDQTIRGDAFGETWRLQGVTRGM